MASKLKNDLLSFVFLLLFGDEMILQSEAADASCFKVFNWTDIFDTEYRYYVK